MNEQLAAKIVEIADKLGFEAARVWPQMVAITWVKAAFWLVAIPLVLVAILVVNLWFWPRVRETDPGLDEFGTFMMVMLVGALTAVVVLVGILSYPDVLAAFLYPEAATVKQMLGK